MIKLWIKLATGILLVTSVAITADVNENWFRHAAISPDGKTVLFSAKGDIYQVSVNGGDAVPIVTDAAWDGHPVWSNDGASIAFASDRNGGLDVYVMDMQNRVPTRLTYHSADDFPTDFTRDNSAVIFSSGRSLAAKSSAFPTGRVHQLYSIPVVGGTPTQELTTAAMDARFSPNGKTLVYMDNKAYEDSLRKHDVSSFARDIWRLEISSGKHRKLTDFAGGDSNPVWSADGKTIYYLSEQGDNNFNVWKMSASGSKKRQLSEFSTHPVRSLSISNDDRLAYSWHGNIYVQKDGGKPQLLDISLVAPKTNLPEAVTSIAGKANRFAVSPSGKEVAFIARGELFVASVEFGTTVRVTDSAEQERGLSWLPDGRSIVFAAERDGVWGIYQVSITDDEELYFFSATKFDEQVLIKGEVDAFQPLVSPDGKKVAYLHQRDEIRVYDLESKENWAVFPAKYNYSYSDGDINFDWSPDSNWLAATYVSRGFLFSSEIGLAPADGSKAPTDVTLSGYGEFAPQWTSEEMILFASDRYGQRAHGSWGSEGDIIGLFLTQEAFDKYNMSKEERELYAEAEKKAKEDKKKAEKEAKEKDKEAKDEDVESKDKDDKEKDEEKPEPIKIDWNNLDERTVRLTRHSSDLGSFALTPDMEKLYYLARFEKGYDLWVQDFKEKSTKLALKLNAPWASFQLNDKGDIAVLLANGQLSKLTLGGSVKRKGIAVNGTMSLREDAERQYLFKHIWRQTNDKFYNPDMHGIDWDKMYEEYLPKVAGIKNNRDFATMTSELLGELNASHTGTRYRSNIPPGSRTASLGALFATQPGQSGLTIEAILPYSPLLKHAEEVKVGSVLTAINGEGVNAASNLAKQLNGTAGQRTRLTFRNGSETTEVVTRPTSMGQEFSGMYKRWVDSRRAYVDELSDGKLAYVHVPQMNDAAYRMVHKELFGRGYDKEGVVVDTRFNRGGWLTDDLVTLLSGKQYTWMQARDARFKGDSMDRWTKPSILVVNEGNYSDGYCFPTGYRANNIGKIVGMPVPGTCTAVWWEGLQTGDLVFGIPQLGILKMDGSFMENSQLEPDIKVENSKDVSKVGEDAQLKRAVEELL